MVGVTPGKGLARYCSPRCEAHWATPRGTVAAQRNGDSDFWCGSTSYEISSMKKLLYFRQKENSLKT